MKRSATVLIIPLIVALAAMASILLMFSQAARLPDGTPALALDDSYIHLQYAWQTSQGHFLQYDTGDAPTTGATSLLYMLLLAGGFALGVSRQAMPGVTLVLGGALFVVTAALLADLAPRVAERAEIKLAWLSGLLAGLLFASSGWMAWAYLSGMETGLLILLATGTLWAVSQRRSVLAAVLASLAALTRPEALILGAVVLASEWLLCDPAEGTKRTRQLLWASMPFGATALSLALNYLLTGAAGSSGLQAKSLFTLVPFYPGKIAGLVAANAFELFVRLLGGPASDGRWHAFPLAQILALLGFGVLWRQGAIASRRFVLICLGWIVLGVAATTTLQTATWHHYRYQMPYYPSLLVPVSLLASWLAAKMAIRLSRQRAWLLCGGAIALVLFWSAYSLVDFAQAYSIDTTTIATMQFPLAAWISQNTPPTSRIAAHDVGTLRFLGGRDVVDVVGLTTPDMAASYRSGPGCLYEALRIARPDYYAVYPDAAPPFFGIPGAVDLLGEEVFRVSPGSFSPYVSATGTQVITQPDWSSAVLADLPQQSDVLARLDGWTLVDRLNVAEIGNSKDIIHALASEAAHGYTWWNLGAPVGFPSDARKMRYRLDPAISLADGGRLLTGGESFTLETKPSQPLLLVARLHQTVDMTLRVRVDGRDAGQWRLPAIPGEWIESTFPIPAEFISKEQTQITITVEEMFEAGPDARYSPFHYWAYQGGDSHVEASQPQTVLQAAFGSAVQLQGFDLSQTALEPGNTLSLSLHWLALDPPHANLRVFAHLVDPDRADTAEGIVAQADSAPRQGTYPFWVWQPHETVVDSLSLAVPADVPAGRYHLLLGIYDAATGQRLAITGADDFGAGRLMLADILIR